MRAYDRVEELTIMKGIAETLNLCNDMHEMLQAVLEKLLELTHLEAGWIFLVDEEPHYTMIADYGLPPALSREEKAPMCSGDCHCLHRYWNNKLTEPVNIIECKRITEAVKNKRGDTEGISHHATIPLGDGTEFFGILNIAAPYKEHFSEEELTLMQSVAYQIGTAIKRTRLYHEEQKRAELYEKLNKVVRSINKEEDIPGLCQTTVTKGMAHFGWQAAAMYVKKNHVYIKQASSGGEFSEEIMQIPEKNGESEAIHHITIKNETVGLLHTVSGSRHPFERRDTEVQQALVRNMALAAESLNLQKERRELLLHEERKRLARDLHDSVNQKLFSLSLTARGVKEMIPNDQQDLREMLEDMLLLSQESQKEMRSLIWQLRPVGIEEGLSAALKKYAVHLGITLDIDMEQVPDWSGNAEETLWRIGQEALNNIKKHTNETTAAVHFYETKTGAGMVLSDCGPGIDHREDVEVRTLGLTSMRERAELAGGSFSIHSVKGRGTEVRVFLPHKGNRKERME
ncbi:GAF domain-containing sensor histidine kinase [Halobacillus kuroshimensis]|uniref:GAF domain-containing sensor histidine kinase n=1 Tax=Halobacillus kuroshimensis TaxID=302481 RepID=UPI0004149940|nr:GAF domain-containing sensor histidine kinase [Halobacillus kuroshimensis]